MNKNKALHLLRCPVPRGNAINLGLPLIECDTDQISEGDVLRVNLVRREIVNETRGASIKAGPMPEFMVTLLNEGGTANFIRKFKKFHVPGARGAEKETKST